MDSTIYFKSLQNCEMENTPILLIGFIIPEFDRCTLASNLQVLRYIFYKMRILNFRLQDSFIMITKEILMIRKKTSLQTQDFSRCKNKIVNLHSQRNVRKSLRKIRNKRTEHSSKVLLKNVLET